jgi:hypothetical protein
VKIRLRQVLVLRLGNLRAFLRALQAQLPLVLALMQIAEVGHFETCPCVGCQVPECGAIWVPSAVMVNCGLGRRYAVISSAFISSTLASSDFSTGFAASNFAFACSQAVHRAGRSV